MVHASDFAYEATGDGRTLLRITGAIESGDAARLRQLITSDTKKYVYADAISVDSPGGSVDEAIQIASIIEESGEPVIVDKGAVCASACFLLFVSAPYRYSVGDVIIHRPYYDMKALTGGSQAAMSKKFQTSILAMSQFLQSRSVPGDLVDKMMDKPSSDGYYLTDSDQQRIGIMSPAVEEFTIQNCGLSNESLLSENQSAVLSCAEKFLIRTKMAYLMKLSLPKLDESSLRNRIQAQEDVIALLERLGASDANFKGKAKRLAPEILRVERSFPPDKWVAEIEAAYYRIN